MRPFPVLLLLSSLVLHAGCDGYTEVGGTVVDGNGQPVEAAKVSLWLGFSQVGIDQVSDKDGKFNCAGSHEPGHGVVKLYVEKEGFMSDRRDLPTNYSNQSLRIVIERAPPPEPDLF